MRKQELHPRTAIINQKQKNLSKKARLDALHWLAITFPDAFDNSVRIRPLKLGIMDDILIYADKAAEAGISKGKLREAVVVFTRRIDYLTCLKAREMRVDLQGNPVDAVTEENAEHAAIKIKKRVEKSAKNARKNSLTGKPASTKAPSPSLRHETQAFDVEHLQAYNMQSPITPSMRATPITIKHKQSRSYDPEAVARLKEKLGLRKTEESVEAN